MGESTVENGRHCDSLLDTGGALKRRGVVREGGGAQRDLSQLYLEGQAISATGSPRSQAVPSSEDPTKSILREGWSVEQCNS